jgi:hypothetical protein
MLNGCSPSASLACEIASSTAVSLTCAGSGSCTRMPSTVGSALSACTVAITSASDASAGRSRPRSRMPTSAHALRFMRTYVALSGRLPTSTTARPGWRPSLGTNASMRALSSERMAAAVALPSMTMGPVAAVGAALILPVSASSRTSDEWMKSRSGVRGGGAGAAQSARRPKIRRVTRRADCSGTRSRCMRVRGGGAKEAIRVASGVGLWAPQGAACGSARGHLLRFTYRPYRRFCYRVTSNASCCGAAASHCSGARPPARPHPLRWPCSRARPAGRR